MSSPGYSAVFRFRGDLFRAVTHPYQGRGIRPDEIWTFGTPSSSVEIELFMVIQAAASHLAPQMIHRTVAPIPGLPESPHQARQWHGFKTGADPFLIMNDFWQFCPIAAMTDVGRWQKLVIPDQNGNDRPVTEGQWVIRKSETVYHII